MEAATYGSGGRIGIGTPQANPVVEAEMGILLPRTCTLHVTRLTSASPEPGQRLVDYLRNIEGALLAFDTLRPDAFGFACTGSSYLLGAVEEERIVAAARSAFGYPIVTATHAIMWGLDRIAARRIAVVAAYPQEIVDAGCRYWTTAGLEVVHRARIATRTADTRRIYELGIPQLEAALDEVPESECDAVLVSGTGLASLPALAAGTRKVPVISSNVCLAARLLEVAGHGEMVESGVPFIRGWRGRLAEAQGGTSS